MTANPATVDDLLSLPDLPRRADLLDGVIIFPPPQTSFHSVATDLLIAGLRATEPPGLRVARQMTIVIDQHNAPEPDLSVIHAEALTGHDQMTSPVGSVVLAGEVVDPESADRDRGVKPRKYAAAGITYYWRVEMLPDSGRPLIHTYELHEESGLYTRTGVHQDRIVVDAPYRIDIDLTAIDTM